MTPERWRQVKAVFHEASESAPADVPGLLDERCGADTALRAEVESLLAAAANSTGGLSAMPPFADAALFRPQIDPMIGRQIGNYVITAELARGGMGVVYRGRHIALPREVVLKCIRPLSAGDAARPGLEARFRREAHIQCQLDHPNIVRVYEFLTEADGCFLVMEYVDGSSVRTLLDRNGPFPAGEVSRLAVQALAGLEHAHTLQYADEAGATGAGVVHRDIKPANVLLDSRGNLKLTDFGIAKASSQTDLTRTGITPGTLDYMSPEQIRALPVDARSDLYSLGLTMYEMLTGRLPFPVAGPSSDYDRLKARVETDAPPVQSLNPSIPAGLAAAVMRALERDPADRWQTAAEFAGAIEHFQAGGRRVEKRRFLSPPRRWAPVARLKRRIFLASAFVVAAILAVLGWVLAKKTYGPGPEPVSIAVLPFADLSPGKDQAYFCRGLAEELFNELARVSGLRVVATASSFQLGSEITDFPAAAKKLNVKAIVEGSVRTQDTQMRIGARLVQGADGVQLWASTYDVEMKDYLAVQEGLAIAIVGALHQTLHPRAEPAPARTSNPEALKAYLEGRYLAQRRTKANLEKAAALFERALALDPSYAKAWVGLGEVRTNQAGSGAIPAAEGYGLAREAIQKALALDPNLADAHAALGRIQLLHDWDWKAADGSFQRTRALEPGGSRALGGALALARTLGRMDEAVALSRVYMQSDPLNAAVFHNAGLSFYWAGKYEEAVAALKRSLELVPEKTITHEVLAQVYLAQGRPAEALAEAEQEKDATLKLSGLALANHALGRRDESDRSLAELKRDHADSPAVIGEVHAYRGETHQAFQWLERAFDERDPGLSQLKGSPLLAGLRRDPRYAKLLSRMRLAQ